MIFSGRDSRCRVCILARIHIVIFLTILAVWRLKPEWFAFEKSTAVRDLATALVLSIFSVILITKAVSHYLDRRSR